MALVRRTAVDQVFQWRFNLGAQSVKASDFQGSVCVAEVLTDLAELVHEGRRVTLELRGLAFGSGRPA